MNRTEKITLATLKFSIAIMIFIIIGFFFSHTAYAKQSTKYLKCKDSKYCKTSTWYDGATGKKMYDYRFTLKKKDAKVYRIKLKTKAIQYHSIYWENGNYVLDNDNIWIECHGKKNWCILEIDACAYKKGTKRVFYGYKGDIPYKITVIIK